MTEFDKLKNDAERYAQEHPDRVKEGEQILEKKLGISQQPKPQQGQQAPDGGQGN